MAQDATQVVVGANGDVYSGPVGTTAPTNATTALAAGFINHGFVSEDGVTITDSKDVTDIMAWQSFYALRKVVTSRDFTVAFALRQWNSRTLLLAFGGGNVAGSSGDWEYTPPDPEDLAEQALVVEWHDGTRDFRLYIPRGIVTENVESTVARAAAADLPVTFSALPTSTAVDAYTLFTDDNAFVAAS